MDLSTSSAGKDNRVEKAIKKLTAATLGCCGSKLIDDTALHTGPFGAVQVIGGAAAVLDVSQMIPCGGNVSIEDFDTDIAISDGAIIYGNFTCLALVSGAVVAYKS
jgi:hypothetical protein